MGAFLALIAIFLMIIFLFGCEDPKKLASAEEFVRATLPITIEGAAYPGVAVVQRATTQVIKAAIPEKAAKLYLTTCHREELWNYPTKNWEYRYNPVPFLENWGSCVMTISVITERGNLLQAIVDFTSNETLQAQHYCNGQKIVSSKGVSFCQGKAGLTQRITFAESVRGLAGTNCGKLRTEGLLIEESWAFDYELPIGWCVYAFRSKKGDFHRLTVRGYTYLPKEG